MARGGNRIAGAAGRARTAVVAGACLGAAVLAACSAVDPYEVTCRELNTSPDKLRQTTLKLAQQDVEAKNRYEEEILRICADAPEDFRPVQRVKPEE